MSSPAPDATSSRRLEGPQILIVDDNAATAGAMASLLGRHGYHTEVFHNGNSAIAYSAAHQTPAAAVVDVHLPDISGLILSHKLRERFGPDTPIIVISGDTSLETLGSLSHVGATYFLSKPVNTTHLVERLREWVPVGRA